MINPGDSVEAADKVRGCGGPGALGAPHLLHHRGGGGERQLQGQMRTGNNNIIDKSELILKIGISAYYTAVHLSRMISVCQIDLQSIWTSLEIKLSFSKAC